MLDKLAGLRSHSLVLLRVGGGEVGHALIAAHAGAEHFKVGRRDRLVAGCAGHAGLWLGAGCAVPLRNRDAVVADGLAVRVLLPSLAKLTLETIPKIPMLARVLG